MDVQATPSPYASLGAIQSPTGNPPVLGSQVPGQTGGLPAQGGLSVLANPMAKELQSYGRGEDTMLVHMTPGEVNSLQGLAMATGGSLTINPHTGLPEAGWLGKLLPTLLGGIGMAFGIPPVWMGALGAVGGTAATGDLGKGLMMGLQAYGGASMAGGLGLAGKVSQNAFGLMGQAGSGMGQAAGAAATNAATNTATNVATGSADKIASQFTNLPGAPTVAGGVPTSQLGITSAADKIAGQFGNLPGAPTVAGGVPTSAFGLPGGADQFINQISNIPGAPVMDQAASVIPRINAAGKTGLAGFMQGFGDSAKMGLPGGIIGKAAPMLAAQGVMSGVSSAMTPSVKNAQDQRDNAYTGPYYSPQRNIVSNATTESILAGNGEQQQWFDTGMPAVLDAQGRIVQPGSDTAPGTPILQNVLAPDVTKRGGFLGLGTKTEKNADKYIQQWVPWMGAQTQPGAGYADGGEVKLADGAFVVDARTVSELGNGSSNAGIEMLARMGGRPVRGPGDGVSDSVPARIGRNQPARVARDEVIFSPEAVRKIGKGDAKRGAKKLYAMMAKAHKARKKAGRGTDTKLRKGLA